MDHRRIVYVSEADPALEARDLRLILETAQERNWRAGLSGLLLHDGEHFLQHLEGPPAAMAPVWAAIRADARHREVTVLVDEITAERAFADWRMGYLRIDGLTACGGYGADALTAERLAERLPAGLPGDVRMMMITFAFGGFQRAMLRRREA